MNHSKLIASPALWKNWMNSQLYFRTEYKFKAPTFKTFTFTLVFFSLISVGCENPDNDYKNPETKDEQIKEDKNTLVVAVSSVNDQYYAEMRTCTDEKQAEGFQIKL